MHSMQDIWLLMRFNIITQQSTIYVYLVPVYCKGRYDLFLNNSVHNSVCLLHLFFFAHRFQRLSSQCEILTTIREMLRFLTAVVCYNSRWIQQVAEGNRDITKKMCDSNQCSSLSIANPVSLPLNPFIRTTAYHVTAPRRSRLFRRHNLVRTGLVVSYCMINARKCVRICV
jgi:hypothetical protein